MDETGQQFDLLVYGATGYTGKKIAQYAIEKYPSLSVAIGGRTESKLLQVADELGLAATNVLVASLEDDGSGSGTNPSLVQAVGKARIVLACAGPYRQCGMPLVKAALLAKTDYLDLCGEPLFFEETLGQCEDMARNNNVLIVSACAFDCVPAELSASLVSREVRKRYQTTCTGIEVCHTLSGAGKLNATTFHAAVDGFHAGSNGDLAALRKKNAEQFHMVKAPKRPSDWPQKPENSSNLPRFHEPSGSYALKFPGADAAAIMTSWKYLRLREPETYKELPNPRLSVCFGVPNKVDAMKVLGFGAVFAALAKFQFGCNVLHGNPGLFSNGVFVEGGPTEEELNQVSLCTYSAGYGNTEEQVVKAFCKGPEPAYVGTSRMIVALALTVLNHREKLPFTGGVMLPGALFGECQEAYGLLKENDIVFEVQESETEDSKMSTNV